MVQDLRAMLRWADGHSDQPTAVIFDSATRQSTPESLDGSMHRHLQRTDTHPTHSRCLLQAQLT